MIPEPHVEKFFTVRFTERESRVVLLTLNEVHREEPPTRLQNARYLTVGNGQFVACKMLQALHIRDRIEALRWELQFGCGPHLDLTAVPERRRGEKSLSGYVDTPALQFEAPERSEVGTVAATDLENLGSGLESGRPADELVLWPLVKRVGLGLPEQIPIGHGDLLWACRALSQARQRRPPLAMK